VIVSYALVYPVYIHIGYSEYIDSFDDGMGWGCQADEFGGRLLLSPRCIGPFTLYTDNCCNLRVAK
jgi:hypothetical protein